MVIWTYSDDTWQNFNLAKLRMTLLALGDHIDSSDTGVSKSVIYLHWNRTVVACEAMTHRQIIFQQRFS